MTLADLYLAAKLGGLFGLLITVLIILLIIAVIVWVARRA